MSIPSFGGGGGEGDIIQPPTPEHLIREIQQHCSGGKGEAKDPEKPPPGSTPSGLSNAWGGCGGDLHSFHIR